MYSIKDTDAVLPKMEQHQETFSILNLALYQVTLETLALLALILHPVLKDKHQDFFVVTSK